MFLRKHAVESLPVPINSLKGKERALALAQAAVRRSRDTVSQVREAHAKAQTSLGTAMVENAETGPFAGMLEDAERGVRLAQSALNIAVEREDIARSELKQATRDAVLEVERQALVHLQSVARQADIILAELETFCERELSPALNTCLLAGAPGPHNNFLKDLQLWFPQFIAKACRAVNPKGDPGLVTRVGRKFFSYVPHVEQHLAARKPNE